jgi:hypothetical protein
MGSWNHYCSNDYRDEGWGKSGSGVSRCYHAWNNDDDTKYCSNPPSKGRATVSFPIDPTDLPAGAVITSVSVYLRAAKTTNISQSITVNVLASDDTAKFTTRTIYLTTTATTYEVGTYTRDPRGKTWDIPRVNKLLAQVSATGTASVTADVVRVFKMYFTIRYRTRPTLTVTGPVGTVKTPTPTVQWTYAQTDGDLQSSAEYKVFEKSVAEAQNFDANNTPPLYTNTVTGDKTSLILGQALTPGDYYVYVRVTSQYGAISLWAGRSFSLIGPAPGVPATTVTGDSTTASAALSLQDTTNLLSISLADVEEVLDTAANPLGKDVSAAFTSLARTTDQFYNLGQGSWKVVATGTGNPTGTSYIQEVSPSVAMTARAQFMTAVTARTCHVDIVWYDDSYTLLSTSASSNITDATTGWTEAVVTATSPATAKYAVVKPIIVSPVNTEVHYIDGLSLSYGTSSAWSPGGHASRNILSSEYSEDPYTAGFTAATGTTLSRSTTVSGITSGGPNGMIMTAATVSPTISYHATSTVFSSVAASVAYTLNKPTVTTGDLMIAIIAGAGASTTAVTCTPPTGWTLVNSALSDEIGGSCMWVLTRTATSSEPASWSGEFTQSLSRCRAYVISYTGAADAADQFISENVLTRSTGTPLYLTSATVANTDPSAWRISAFATRDGVASGAMTANTQPPFVGVSYVGKATKWSSTYNSTSYTINKPAGGVTTGDLLVATLVWWGSSTTVTAPTGWTLSGSVITASDDSDSCSMQVMIRTATSTTEPGSWSGTTSSGRYPRITQCVAYRTAADKTLQFLASNTSTNTVNENQITTGAVTNTSSESWRLCIFGGVENGSDGNPSSWSSNENSVRVNDYVEDDEDIVTVGIFDSGTKVSTGSHSKTGTMSDEFDSSVSFIGLIKVLGTPPTPPANLTERVDGVSGAADPYLQLAIYDSNAVIPIGNSNVTGTFVPGSGTDIDSIASWVGVIKPASPIIAGNVTATMSNTVDVVDVDEMIPVWANSKMTARASFTSTVTGTSYLTMYFYNGNQLISSETKLGSTFDTTYTPAYATFDIPDKTTRVKLGVTCTDRAVADTVTVDQLSIAYGESNVYRPGTNRSTHPIWSVPIIQYTDDDGSGYTDWANLGGVSLHQPIYDATSGVATFTDHTLIPQVARKYRAATLSYGLNGDQFVSDWGAESSPVTIAPTTWWLKDLLDPTNNLSLNVKSEAVPIALTNMASVFQPLGASAPVVLTEGYKSDIIGFTCLLNRSDWVNLRKLLRSGTSLFLQTDVDEGWWVKPIEDLAQATWPTYHRQTDPLREVHLKFVQVATEE